MKSCLPAHNSQVRSRTYITKQELSTSAEAYGTNTTQHRKNFLEHLNTAVQVKCCQSCHLCLTQATLSE